MSIKLLVISDIHGNFPALTAVQQKFKDIFFDHIINCGDSTVYTPFANETLNWLQVHKTLSILGNTDKKVIKLLMGKSFKKPGKHEKKIMYSSTAKSLSTQNSSYLCSLPKSRILKLQFSDNKGGIKNFRVGIYHGSPSRHHEFLFSNTPDGRYMELANQTKCQLILTGHSHTPYHKYVSKVHFVNPGSVGRMFDGDPRASCAIVDIDNQNLSVTHYRIEYEIGRAIDAIRKEGLPEIYTLMLQKGKKLN